MERDPFLCVCVCAHMRMRCVCVCGLRVLCGERCNKTTRLTTACVRTAGVGCLHGDWWYHRFPCATSGATSRQQAKATATSSDIKFASRTVRYGARLPRLPLLPDRRRWRGRSEVSAANVLLCRRPHRATAMFVRAPRPPALLARPCPADRGEPCTGASCVCMRMRMPRYCPCCYCHVIVHACMYVRMYVRIFVQRSTFNHASHSVVPHATMPHARHAALAVHLKEDVGHALQRLAQRKPVHTTCNRVGKRCGV